MTEPTILEQIIALATSHGALGLIALIVLYARKILSPASGFPITVPPRWLPFVSAVGGLVFGAVTGMQAGQSIGIVAVGAVIGFGSTGALDSLMTAIFDHDNAPAWARAIVFVFDDITGHGPGAGPKAPRMTGGKAFAAPVVGGSVPPPAPISASPPTVPPVSPDTLRRGIGTGPQRGFVSVRGLVSMLGLSLVLGAATLATGTGCTQAQWQSFVTSAGQFLTYVATAINTVEAIWAVVQPLIPAAASAEATALYNDAKLSLDAAMTAFQDAINAGNATQTAPVDYATLEANVVSAFEAVVAVVDKWQPLAAKSPALGARADVLAHQAAVIKGWR